MRAAHAIAVLALAGCAGTVSGRVFVDTNRDGVAQSREPGVAGAVVALDRIAFARTDAEGFYTMDVPLETGVVWVRVPDGFRAGPVWRRAGTAVVDLGVTPAPAAEPTAPVTFVIASDSHTTMNPADPWDGGDLADAIDQALGLPEPPDFFTIVGDITQGNTLPEFARVNEALAGRTVPWVPVPGNHDWYDGGTNYRETWGPDNYSFDVRDVHFVVWDTNLPDADQIAFVTADLAGVPADMTIVALGHASPVDAVADAFAAAGVDYMFTGHWHANRRVDRASGLVEWGTQTFTMGGIDESPSGYRVVTFAGGVPQITHRDRLVSPHLDLAQPHRGSCADPTGFEYVAAAALDASTPVVTARLDCGPALPLVPIGDWAFRGRAPALAPGTHSVELTATSPSGRTLTRQIAFAVCPPATGALVTTDWPQAGGGPDHRGAQTAAIDPPLIVRWATTVPGTPALGTPVVAGDTVVVSLVDRAAGDAGGVVALDVQTGAVKWRVQTPSPVPNAPAIADGTVVIALSSGEVRAVELATGRPRWSVDLAAGLPEFESSLWAAPTIADDVVYAGVQGNFAALDLETGAALWSRNPAPPFPWLGTRAAAAVADGTVVAAFNRTGGLFGWNAATGAQRWTNTTGLAHAVNTTPAINAGVAYVANASGDFSAIDLDTGAAQWSRPLTPGGFDWGYSIMAAPAYADGRVFVATQWRTLLALDAQTGAELWRATTPNGPLNFAHYRSAEPGFVASPIVTGGVVWIGRPDGVLVAFEAATGREVWTTQLGAPIDAAVAPAGKALFVATHDGTTRAMVSSPPAVVDAVAPCVPLPSEPTPPDAADPGGNGGCDSSDDAGVAAALVALGLLARRRRRRPVLAG